MQQTSSGDQPHRSLFFLALEMPSLPITIPTAAPESRLSQFCAHLAEACWLGAAAMIPLLYDPNAVNGFDSIKPAALRTFGIVIVGATMVRSIGAFSRRNSALAESSLFSKHLPLWLLSGLAIVFAALLATVFSVDPARSFWGSSYWLQGTLTLGCQVGFFLGIAANLRTGEQIDRLVNTALAASIPVAIYALLQRAGLNPGNPVGDPGAATSFAGHPIFLAGYLLMLLPLCVWRLWTRLRSGSSAGICFFSVVLLLQIMALFSTEKRGPLVALLLAGAFGILLLAACFRRFRWVGWGIAVAAAGGITLVLLAVLGRERLLPPGIPLLGRLSMVVPISAETGDVFRASLWAKGPEVVLAAKPFLFPDGTPDRWHWLRPLLGFGPETLQGVLPHYWLWVRGGPALLPESRFHNMFWEAWQSVGLLGLVAWWSFYAAIFWTGTRTLGLADRRSGVALASTATAMGALAALLLSGLYGWGYLGLGFQIGFAAGLVFATIGLAFARRNDPLPPSVEDSSRWLVVALLVALLGHQIDMGFSFPTGNTSLLFWLFSGVIAGRAIGLQRGNEPARAAAAAGSKETEPFAGKRSWISAGLVTGCLSGAILIAVLHGFISLLSTEAFTAWDVLDVSLTRLRSSGQASHLFPFLLLPTWGAANLCILAAFWNVPARDGYFRALALSAVLSGGIAAGFALLQAQWIASVGPIPQAGAPLTVGVAQASWLGFLGVTFFGGMLALTFALARGLKAVASTAATRTSSVSQAEIAASVLAVLSALLVLWPAVANVQRYEAFSKWALVLDAHDQKKLSTAVYERAFTIQPRDVPNRIMGALAWMACAETEKDPRSFSAAMEKSSALLLSVRSICELNFANYHLGRVFLRWGLRTPDTRIRTALGEQASEALTRATKFAPEAETAWVEASLVDRVLRNDPRAANEKLCLANALTSHDANSAPWGDFYARQAFSDEDATIGRFHADRGIYYLRSALAEGQIRQRLKKLSPQEVLDLRFNAFRSLVTLARLEKYRGHGETALAYLLEATRTGDEHDVWEAEALLSRLYVESGNLTVALEHFEAARAKAPKEAGAELADLHQQISKSTLPK